MAPVGADDASARLRAIWPGVMLANRGDDVSVLSPDWTFDVLLDNEDHVREVAPLSCDVLVMQRTQARQLVEAIPLIQAQGTAVVVDIDDDFSQVHPRNAAYAAVHPKGNPATNRRWLALACKAADMVTCTTPALAAKYGHHGRCRVIPNRLPRQVLSIEHTDAEPLRIGWGGNIAVHPNDLQVTGGAVRRVTDELGVVYVNVGPGGTAKALGLETERATGFVDARRWFSRLATEVDIGIVPLEPTKFNAAKSSLALLTVSSVGVPAVVSPTPDNRRLHDLGMGVLAETPDDWYHQLRRLVTDEGRRAEVAARSKQAARGETLEAHLDPWVEAWALARHLHSRRR